MSSRKVKTQVVVLAEPRHSPSPSSYNTSAFLAPPRLPSDSARSSYPRPQTEDKSQYQPYPPRSSLNDQRSYGSADEAPYDYQEEFQYTMSLSSSRSTSPGSQSGGSQSYSSEPSYGVMRSPIPSGMYSVPIHALMPLPLTSTRLTLLQAADQVADLHQTPMVTEPSLVGIPLSTTTAPARAILFAHRPDNHSRGLHTGTSPPTRGPTAHNCLSSSPQSDPFFPFVEVGQRRVAWE